MHADPTREGTVWIAEDLDREDALLLTGRFSGYLERNERRRATFESLEPDEAIAWGRARATAVLIRTGDGGCYFSAGERNPDPERYPAWPPEDVRLERRRPRGFEALDNTEHDPPVLWDVRIEAGHSGTTDLGPFNERVRSDPAARNAQVPAPGYGAPSAAFLVEASTRDQAERIANRILEEAFAALVEAFPIDDADYWLGGPEVYPYRPDKPARGPGVIY